MSQSYPRLTTGHHAGETVKTEDGCSLVEEVHSVEWRNKHNHGFNADACANPLFPGVIDLTFHVVFDGMPTQMDEYVALSVSGDAVSELICALQYALDDAGFRTPGINGDLADLLTNFTPQKTPFSDLT